MFGFFKKRAEVLNHWIAFAEGFQMPPSEFYQSLERELSRRKVPSLELSRIEFAQGGLLSNNRIYLRMLRERIVFDVCAAPFGTGFFFSCRTAEIPIKVRLWEILALILLGMIPTLSALNVFPRLWVINASIFFGLTGLILLFIFRSAVLLGLCDPDRLLIQVPVVGAVYILFFRKESYYRIDSRLCYLQTIPTLVRQLAEDASAAQGIKLMQQFELSPVLGELYKPARRETVDLNISVDDPPIPIRAKSSF